MGVGDKKVAKDADWVQAQQDEITRERCPLCLHVAGLAKLRELLGLMAEHGAHKISKLMLYERLCETVPGFRKAVTYRTVQNHLQCHDRARWDAAKGRG